LEIDFDEKKKRKKNEMEGSRIKGNWWQNEMMLRWLNVLLFYFLKTEKEIKSHTSFSFQNHLSPIGGRDKEDFNKTANKSRKDKEEI